MMGNEFMKFEKDKRSRKNSLPLAGRVREGGVKQERCLLLQILNAKLSEIFGFVSQSHFLRNSPLSNPPRKGEGIAPLPLRVSFSGHWHGDMP
jgi:hypothetical protein